jgi:cytochrome b6-f complex iron-sulfur subunit
MAKKQSTADILARLRAETKAKDQGGPAQEQPAQAPADRPAAPAAPAGESAATAHDAAAAETAPASATPGPSPAAPKAVGAKPKSTKDILAALRAEGAAGTSAAPAPAKPAVSQPAGKQPAKPAPAAESGKRLSVQEMLRAARQGLSAEQQPAPATPAPAAAPKPKVPAAARKAREAEQAEAQPTRRNVLLSLIATPFAAGWTSFTAATAAFTLAMARFMMPNVLVAAPSRFKIGPPSDYPPDAVSEKWKAEFGVWVVNTMYNGQRQIYALVSVCTHLGCTPNWLQGEQKFKCPCHGSGFYISGINFEGPAPRPLERAGITIAPDGMLEVDKSLKFQEEMGQWADPTSFVPVV